MKLYPSAFLKTLVVGLSLMAGVAQAVPLLTTSGALTAADPTQLGRLSRNAVAQSWDPAMQEPFPGTVNPTTTYSYHTYTFNVGMNPYVEISFDGSSTLFISAYQTSYAATNLVSNWLGDIGTSGLYFGVDTLYFQVIAAVNSQLVLVVNETTTGGGRGMTYGITADGFLNSGYEEFVPTAVPEPETLLLMLAPLALIAGRKSRKRREAVAA